MLINIEREEVKAIDELLKDVECSCTMGYILVRFRMKIQQAINTEKKREELLRAKEILGVKKKD